VFNTVACCSFVFLVLVPFTGITGIMYSSATSELLHCVHTHTHNCFTALLDFVRNYPDELALEG